MADAIAAFAPALSELAIDAWERCGIKAGEVTVTHLNSMRRSMNLVLVRWANRGINLWRVTQNTLPLVTGVAAYTLNANMIDMLDTYITTSFGGVANDIIMTPMGRDTYAALPTKSQAGRPIMYMFDKTITPTVTLWPVPDTANYTLNYFAFTQITDADPSAMNIGNLPYRFLEAYTAGLAAHLAIKWAPERAMQLDASAKDCWVEAADEDREMVTLTMAPDLGAFL